MVTLLTELSICVPTFRGWDRVSRLLASVERHTSVTWEAVVVDCGNQLRGYTAPQNQAMTAGRGKYLLCVNDDVELSEGWYEPLKVAVDAGAWCATPDMEHSDGPQIYAPYCALWNSGAWNHMGGLDSQFRHWCSDIDMARRLVDADHTPVKVKLPQPVTHEINATLKTEPQYTAELQAICNEDMQRFQRKWGVAAESEKYRLRDLVWP